MRAYYVVWVEDQSAWGVKLEKGRYIEKGIARKRTAINRAKELAKSDSATGEKVVVNSKEHYTQRHINP